MREVAFQKVSQIMRTSPLIFSSTDTVSSLLGRMIDDDAQEALVKYRRKIGLVVVGDLLRVSHPNRTLLGRIARNIMHIAPESTILKAVDLMVTNKAWALLVRKERGDITGIISQLDIMKTMTESSDLQKITCKEAMKTPVVCINLDEKISSARSIMNKHDVSYLPVIDEGEELIGVITARDILSNLIQPKESVTRGSRGGNIVRMWDIPVKGLMNRHPLTARQEDSLLEVVRDLKNHRKDVCIVEENSKVLGIITPTEIISLLLKFKAEERMRVYIIGLMELGDFQDIATAQDKIIRVINKAYDFHQDIVEIVVDVKRRRKSGRRTLYQVAARVYLLTELITVTAQGWYLSKAFDNLCRKLDRQLVNKKTKDVSKQQSP